MEFELDQVPTVRASGAPPAGTDVPADIINGKGAVSMGKISVGLGSIVGLVGSGAAVLIPLIGELADAVNPLGVSPKVWVTVSAVLAGLVVVGRMAQAVAQINRGGA